ncbi:hypothetical protein A6E15_02465 [Natrinema saccharevitans]|uniref:Uncharacterized protein n=1 Tax=Natrinema saccharevitans TaxID=301967 RepID=A0A1S8ASV7_9EURY|nr:hypothetical protein [Natrinema saccharevitans]OLZ39913.1 hypothetical protein A6E15_02465 [Natrinema saccharevitans]
MVLWSNRDEFDEVGNRSNAIDVVVVEEEKEFGVGEDRRFYLVVVEGSFRLGLQPVRVLEKR